MQATFYKLYGYCKLNKLPQVRVPEKQFFHLTYNTNIPRQKGLGGSSAIVIACFNCLFQFFELTESQFPIVHRPEFCLNVELHLGIAAGLMDRVVQVYGGVVYMDFSTDRAKIECVDDEVKRAWEAIDVHNVFLPLFMNKLFLVYDPKIAAGESSGKVHSDVRERWIRGFSKDIDDAMKEIAALAERGKTAIEQGDLRRFAELMNENFALRRRLFGDAVLGADNIKMVETCAAAVKAEEEEGASGGAKFTGSGGAVVVLCLDEKQVAKLKKECFLDNWTCESVQIGPVVHSL